jgi:hypothetical protein
MTSDGSSIDRLREYLQCLSAEARAMLIAELERAMLREEDFAGSGLVLQELRRTVRAAAQPTPRIGDAARRFFMPLEPFLVDGPADHKRIGRLARVSLEPIWEWIGRDLMPAEAKALSEDINRALAAEDRLKVEQLVRALHERAIQRMNDALAALGSNEKARRRFSVEVGTPRAVEDVTTLVRILGIRDALADLARRLPDHIRAFEREQIDQVKTLLEGASAQKSFQHAPSQKSELFLYGLIVVAGRLAAPWQLISIATRAAESDDAARIAGTPYAVAVTIVLGELEAMVGELRSELKAGRPVASLLKAVHDAARGMRTEMDLSVDSAWSRQLAAIRSAVSNLLSAEIETTTGRVRRLLRPRPAKEIVPGSLLDAIDVHEVETRVELVGVCRHYASELAVSEVTLRTYSELTQYLETGTRILLDALRQADDAERPFRQSQVDAAVRFCRTVLGADYAGMLAKAADVAVHGATVERKTARA